MEVTELSNKTLNVDEGIRSFFIFAFGGRSHYEIKEDDMSVEAIKRLVTKIEQRLLLDYHNVVKNS